MRVMIRVPNWVGDAVMAAPALAELRRIFKDAHLTLAARPWVAGLFEGEGVADAFLPIRDARGAVDSARRFFEDARRLRRERFDAAVLLQNAGGAALVARAAGIPDIAGYPTDGRGLLLRTRVPLAENYKTEHQVRYYLRIAAGVEQARRGTSEVDLDATPVLRATPQARARARELLKEAEPRFDASAPLLAINPGATNSRAKQWPAERFAAAADLMAEREGFQAVIIGAESDRAACEAVARQMRTPAIQLAGRTTIAELKGVLASAALVLSNDTGAAHVSAALGVPTVVVFGPTEHFATRPLSDRAAVVRHQVECSPCMLRDCPIDHRCMTRVEVADVDRAARSLLVQLTR